MDGDAIREIVSTSQQARTAQVLDLYPGKKLVTYNGTQEKIDVPVTLRTVEASDLQSFGQAAKLYGCGEIWLSAERFVAIPREYGHFNPKVIFAPRKSPVFDLFSVARTYTQSELILLLRTVFRDVVQPAGLLAAVRAIKVVNSSTQTSDQQATGSKMGSEIIKQATGASDLPEDISYTSTVFDDWADRHEATTFDVAFACDAQQPPKFHFTPVRQQVDDAIREALVQAEDELRAVDGSFEVLRGKPLSGY